MMEVKESTTVLKKLLKCVTEEMECNPAFAEKIGSVLEGHIAPRPATRSKKRAPAKLNPLELICVDADALQTQLQTLTLVELKDIIAEYGMDTAKLAMNWRKKDRLIALIMDTAQRRVTKGDAFRG